MENSFQGQTINLGGNISGAVPPVFGSIPQNTVPNQVSGAVNLTTSGYAQQVATTGVNQVSSVTVPATEIPATKIEAINTPITEVQQMTSSVTFEPPVQTKTVQAPAVVEGEIIIPTVLLREMIRVARKVGVYNNAQPQSEVLNLIIDNNGITMRTSNGPDDYECVDKTFSFTGNLTAAVDIKLFGDFMNTVSSISVKLDFDEATGVLTVITDTGTFKFPQRMDASTQLPVITTLKYDMNYDEMQPLNYNVLMDTLNLTKPVRDFAKGFETIRGAFFSDIVITSDASIMLMQDNITDFKNRDFFIGGELCDLIGSVEFNPLACKVGYVNDDEGNLRGIVVSDGRTKLCGPIDVQTDLPVELCKQFWGSTNFVKKINVSVQKCVNVIKSVIPFINANYDKDCIALEIEGNAVRVISRNGAAVDTIMGINTENYKTPVALLLPAVKLFKILQTVKSETFDIMIDPSNNDCICLQYDNFKCIVALSEG